MSYNGYKNYQTHNVILWINNNQCLYSDAMFCKDYGEFKSFLREANEGMDIAFETPDGVAWNDSAIDLEAVSRFWKESFLDKGR